MALKDKVQLKIWEKKNYIDIILYALSANGPLNRGEFIKDYSESVINDEYTKYLNKTTFYKYLNKLLEKKYVIPKRTGKYVYYEITPSGQANLLNRLANYDLDFITLVNLEQKRIKNSVKKFAKFFEDYNISNEEVQVEFLQLANEINPEKLSSFSEEQFNKLLLYLVLNNPKFYNYGDQFIISIHDFLIKYNKTERGYLSETDINYFIQEAVEKNIFNINIFKLNLGQDKLFLYFRSNSEEGIIFETIIKNQLKYLSYLKNITEKERISQDNWDEIIWIILFRLIKKYKTFHSDLEKPLYFLILSFIENIRKAFQKEPTKAIIDKDLTFIPTDLPKITKDYVPKFNETFLDDDVLDESFTDVEFSFVREEYQESEYFLKAREFYNQKDYKAALRYLDKAIEDSPENSENNDLKAHILHILKRYEESLYEIDKVIELEPEWGEIYQKKAYILSDMKKYENAIDSIDNAIELGEDLDMYYKDKANLLCKLEEYDEALKTIEKSIELTNEWETPYYVKAKILFKMNRDGEALATINKAIDLVPEWGSPFYLKAKILIRMNEISHALEQINIATEWNPNKSEYFYLKAELLSREIFQEYDISSDYTNSSEVYLAIDSAIELDSRNAKYFQFKADFLSFEQRYFEALDIIRKAISLDPDNPEFYFSEAVALAGLNKYKQAIGAIDKAIKLNPQNLSYYDYKAEIFSYDHQYEEAIKCVDKALELNEGSNLNLELYTSKANYLEILGKRNDALNIIDKVLEIDSNNYTAIYRKVEILNGKKEYDLALELANKGIELLPKTIGCHQEKIDLLVKLEKFDEALKAIEYGSKNATSSFKKNINYYFSKVYRAKAESNIKNNKKQEAISTAKKLIELKPKNGYYYNAYAEVLMKLKEYHEAIRQLKYGLQIISNRNIPIKIYSNLSKCYRALGLFEEAWAYEEKIPLEDEYEIPLEFDYEKTSLHKFNIEKLEIFLKRLKEIFEQNEWKPILRSNIVDILTLEELLDKKYVDNVIDELIKEGTLSEPKSDYISYSEK